MIFQTNPYLDRFRRAPTIHFILFHSIPFVYQSLFDSSITNMPRYSSSVDGAELFYHYYTPEGRPAPLAGEPASAAKSLTLVLLHQWPLTSRMYDSIILGLCETHGYNVIAPDRRGFGKSDWSGPQSTAAIGYKELGQDLSGLLEKVQPGPFVFVASSMSTGEALLAYLYSPYVQENCQVSHMAGQLTKSTTQQCVRVCYG
jgi:pimeloyl-ACP methyl ester carboxylesterase